MNKLWHDEAWEDYVYWQTQDKKYLRTDKKTGFFQLSQSVSCYNRIDIGTSRKEVRCQFFSLQRMACHFQQGDVGAHRNGICGVRQR